MSRFIAKEITKMYNADGELMLCFVIPNENKVSALTSFEELKNKKLIVEPTEYKSKRSLEQNRLLWTLLSKLSDAQSSVKDTVSVHDCYCRVLEEANVKYEFLLALPETRADLMRCYRAVRKVGERVVQGKTLDMYQCYKGSSSFTTKEMNELIEHTIRMLEELGVYDSEIQSVLEGYRG